MAKSKLSKFNLFLIGVFVLCIGIAASFAATSNTTSPSSPLIASNNIDNTPYDTPELLVYNPLTRTTHIALMDKKSFTLNFQKSIPNFKGETISYFFSDFAVMGRDLTTNKLVMRHYDEATYKFLGEETMPTLNDMRLESSVDPDNDPEHVNSFIYTQPSTQKKGIVELNIKSNTVKSSKLFSGVDSRQLKSINHKRLAKMSINNSLLYELQNNNTLVSKGVMQNLPAGVTCNSIANFYDSTPFKNEYLCFANAGNGTQIYTLDNISTTANVVKGRFIPYIIEDTTSSFSFNVNTNSYNGDYFSESFSRMGQKLYSGRHRQPSLTVLARTMITARFPYDNSSKTLTAFEDAIIAKDLNNRYFIKRNTRTGLSYFSNLPGTITNFFFDMKITGKRFYITTYNSTTKENIFYKINYNISPNTSTYTKVGVIKGEKITGISTSYTDEYSGFIIKDNTLNQLKISGDTFTLQKVLDLRYASANDLISSCKSLYAVKTTYFCLTPLSSTQDILYRVSKIGVVTKIATLDTRQFISNSNLIV